MSRFDIEQENLYCRSVRTAYFTITTDTVGTIQVVVQSSASGTVNSKSWTAVEDN